VTGIFEEESGAGIEDWISVRNGDIGNLGRNYKGPEIVIVVPAPPFPRTRPESYVWATKCQGDQRPVGQGKTP
jgi:hypothetical protein